MLDIEPYRSGLGELDRIAKKIDQALGQPQPVASEFLRQRRRFRYQDRDIAFEGARRGNVERLVDNLTNEARAAAARTTSACCPRPNTC